MTFDATKALTDLIEYSKFLIGLLFLLFSHHMFSFSSPRGSSHFPHYIYNHPYTTNTLIIAILSALASIPIYTHVPPSILSSIIHYIPNHIPIHIAIYLLLSPLLSLLLSLLSLLLYITTNKIGTLITSKTSVSDPGPPLATSLKMRLGEWGDGTPYDYTGWEYVESDIR